MEHNFIENQLIILTKETLDVFFKQENSAELIALYTFYYYTAKWQKTNQPKCTTSFAAKALHWSENKVRKVKKQLIDFKLIEDVKRRDSSNKITGHYVKISFIFKNDTLKENETSIKNNFHPNDFAQGGNGDTMELRGTNALSSNSLNALSSNSLNALSSNREEIYKENEKNEKLNKKQIEANIKNEFETIWKEYPNKKGKDKAFTYYKKARESGTSYDEVYAGLQNYLKEIRIQRKEKQFIKNGSTWFYNHSWNDEYNFDPPMMSNQKQLVNINGKDYIYKNGEYFIPRGSGIAVDPFAEDDLPF